MKIALIQGNYFPWIGYFAVINSVDLFLVYEDVQYTKNDYRNRNWIYGTDRGHEDEKIWLTVPVAHRNSTQRYLETEVADQRWIKKHRNTLQQNLKAAPNWNKISDSLDEAFEKFAECRNLFEINRIALSVALSHLEIKTPIKYISKVDFHGSPSEKVAEIIKENNGRTYISGSAAKSYIVKSDFDARGIDVQWCDYSALIESMCGKNNLALSQIERPESVLKYLAYKEQ